MYGAKMKDKIEISEKAFSKEELIMIKMGLVEMVRCFQYDHRYEKMYQAAFEASEKVEQMLIECGVIGTVEWK